MPLSSKASIRGLIVTELSVKWHLLTNWLNIELSNAVSSEDNGNLFCGQGRVRHKPRRPTWPTLILVSAAWSNWEYSYSPLDGMLVHQRGTPSSMWRERMWGKVSCLRKQLGDRDGALNHRPSYLKSNALTTTLPCPLIKTSHSPHYNPGGSTLQIFGWGCAAGTLKPLP